MQSGAIILLCCLFCYTTRANALVVVHKPSAGKLLKLERNRLDTIHDFACWSMFRTTGSNTVCTCKPQYGTVISKAGHKFDCLTPGEVGCHYSLGNDSMNSAFLVRHRDESVDISPRLPEHSKIRKISIWNHYGQYGPVGAWDDITDVATRFLKMEQENSTGNTTSKLSIRNLELDKWSGHLVKFDFGNDGKCALAKLKGRIQYPIDVNEFKRDVMHMKTTTLPGTTSMLYTTPQPAPRTTTKGSAGTTIAPQPTSTGQGTTDDVLLKTITTTTWPTNVPTTKAAPTKVQTTMLIPTKKITTKAVSTRSAGFLFLLDLQLNLKLKLSGK